VTALAVGAKGLAKRYRLGGRRTPYGTLREALMGLVRRPADAAADRHLWALRDVSFEIQHGETVAIIGRNGAGKSTLMKILSRITEPTVGEARVAGRVGALLEVGTGFHPELTGRENIYLNGSILGMSRADVRRRLDEIIAFAEIERFLETPVKYYSSGMYTRLAFSVAAHLEPDVLIVDEVLAVGDAQFQRKCLGKMSQVAAESRTVLFVSHNMPAVNRLCRRSILLKEGQIVADGPTPEVVGLYLSSDLGTTAVREWPDPTSAPGNDIVRLRRVRVRLEDDRTAPEIDIRRPVGIDVEYDILREGHLLTPNLHFFTQTGECAFITSDTEPEWRRQPRPRGRFLSTAWVPGNFLAEGVYIVGVAMSTMDPLRGHFDERDAISFQVVDTMEGDSARGDYAGPMPGVVRPMLTWTTEYEASAT
jgi:lipopolysaccharide transport system ATP-binding protein